MVVDLTLAISDADRHRALIDGKVDIEVGSDSKVIVEALPVQEMFDRLLGNHEFDISEMPIASYIRMVANNEGGMPYVAVPVFPSRFFRHSCVFVSKASKIINPADLSGKRIGVAVFDMAAAVWIRGIFRDDYGLDPKSPIYVTGGLDSPRTGDAHPQFYPPGFNVEHIGSNQCLADLLAEGSIDALYTASAPRTFFTDPERVGRLFDNVAAVEKDFFARTGNFPIMHTLAFRSELAETTPALAEALVDAFAQSQAQSWEALRNSAALAVSLPWLSLHIEETFAELGKDFWTNGVEPSRAGLETLIGYMFDEGLISRWPTVDELFPLEKPSTKVE